MTEFISTWYSKYTYMPLKLPLISSGTYDFDIDWGDGVREHVNSHNCSHYYPSNGFYTIKIKGIIKGWKTNDDSLREILQWGCLKLGNEGAYFERCKNLVITATDAPNLSETTNLSNMFTWCEHFNSPIGHWDVSRITNMSSMFRWCDDFNQDISAWDVSQVRNMDGMFNWCTSFNQNISGWNVDRAHDGDIFFCCPNMSHENMPIRFRPRPRPVTPLINNQPIKLLKWILPVYEPMDCSICLMDMTRDEWRTSECKGSKEGHYHAFHNDCGIEWFKEHNTCPYCRETI